MALPMMILIGVFLTFGFPKTQRKVWDNYCSKSTHVEDKECIQWRESVGVDTDPRAVRHWKRPTEVK